MAISGETPANASLRSIKSSKLGSQTPRIAIAPTVPILDSYGDLSAKLAADSGLELDDWQKTELTHWLGVQPSGKWSCYEACLILARQNGKGALIAARELAALFLLDQESVIHTAHEHRTAMNGYKELRKAIERNPDLNKLVQSGFIKFKEAHGEEGVYIPSTGQSVRFMSRTKAAARGFSCDLLIFDEAMILDFERYSASLPTMSATPNSQIIVTGSAGIGDPSEVLGRMRRRAERRIEIDRFRFAEFSIELCDRNCPTTGCSDHLSWDDDEAIRLTNPALGRRIDIANVRVERASMGEDKFKIERLSVGEYPAEANDWAIIAEDPWREAATSDTFDTRTLALAVDMPPSREETAIAVCGRNASDKDKFHAELLKINNFELAFKKGVDWALPVLIRVAKQYRCPVVIDPSTNAASFIKPLEDAGVDVIKVTYRDYGEACSALSKMVSPARNDEPTLTHADQPEMDFALAGAQDRVMREFWAWDREKSSASVTPLIAFTLAVWGARNRPKPARPIVGRLELNR